MAKWLVLLIAACFLGCGQDTGRVVERSRDNYGESYIVKDLSASPPCFEANWSSHLRLMGAGSASVWRFSREFASVDSARQYIADVRAAYISAYTAAKSASPDTGATSYATRSYPRSDAEAR